MSETAFVAACTTALAVVGFSFGHTLHGFTAALVPTLAGAAGGFGAGWGTLDVLRRWRAASTK